MRPRPRPTGTPIPAPTDTPVTRPIVLPISITPSAGYAGTRVTASGTGWPAGQRVLITVAVDRNLRVEQKDVLARATVDRQGNFEAAFSMPEDAKLISQPTVWVVAATADRLRWGLAPFEMQPDADLLPARPDGSEAGLLDLSQRSGGLVP